MAESRSRRCLEICVLSCLIAFIFLSPGCASTSLPPFDLAAPGWTVRQGQAVWQPDSEKPEIAGDLVISTHPTAGTAIQFSKTFPIVAARVSPEGWEFEAVPEKKRYSGRGDPPGRLVWLQLARVLEGAEAPDRWTVARSSEQFIVIVDPQRGERLEVQLQ